MTKLKYPNYIELLKLKKEHPIYVIAALTLGIDPRCLKLFPIYDPSLDCYTYDEEMSATPEWYLPKRAEQIDAEAYIKSESDSLTLVPLKGLHQDLGIYNRGAQDILYQELKSSLTSATRDKDIECPRPDFIDEDLWLKDINESRLVTSESVKQWFSKNNFSTPFFEAPPKPNDLPNYLDKNHPEHSQELAIAIEAWQRFTDLDISHPKAYIEKWLDETFVSDKQLAEQSVDTYVSKDAKERITTTANWRKKGGPKSQSLKQSIYDKATERNLSQ